jgi:hypothetical protein
MWQDQDGSDYLEDGFADGTANESLTTHTSLSAGIPNVGQSSKSNEAPLDQEQHCELLGHKNPITYSSLITCVNYKLILLGNSTEQLSLSERVRTLLLCKLIGLLSFQLPQVVLVTSLMLGMLIWKDLLIPPALERDYQQLVQYSKLHLLASEKKS